jgi:hypothetical protein
VTSARDWLDRIVDGFRQHDPVFIANGQVGRSTLEYRREQHR